MSTKTKDNARPDAGSDEVKAFIREAMTWPSIREVAEEWGMSEAYVRKIVEKGRVTAVRLNTIRIDPDSWDRYVNDIIWPGEF